MNKLEVIGYLSDRKNRYRGHVSCRMTTIFEETVYDYDILKTRLRETAFLTKGLRIVLRDLRTSRIAGKEPSTTRAVSKSLSAT